MTIIVLSGLHFGGAYAQNAGLPIQNQPVAQQAPAQRQSARKGAGQGVAPSGPGSAQSPNMAPNTPMVTFQGLCGAPRDRASCKTVITREELDRFINAFSPKATGAARGRMAVQYATVLAYSMLAEQRGFDKDPALANEIEAQLKLIRMRILATAFAQALREQAPAATDADIQGYYAAHPDLYQQVEVRRISVPLEGPDETGKPLDRAAVLSAMEEIRKAAVGGEDFNKLQQQVYRQFRIATPAPPVTVITIQRRSLQGGEAKLFDLKPGAVSSVLDLPGAIAVEKLEGKGTAPLASVRAEIEAWLRGTKAQAQLAKFTGDIKTEFNLDYLELPSQPDLFGVGRDTAAASGPTAPGTSTTRR
ncbi:MAG TPA: peptidylprolyl isomerase [Bryobacteraceae bacterium]|nr:peptidylprolyl isomerase [Bryobacteraceae bacterium]